MSLDNNLQSYIHNQPPAATESNRPIPFDFVAVSEDEINLIIMSMPANKSAGPDKINMCIIRDSLPYILTPLTNIINSSLSSNIYPETRNLAQPRTQGLCSWGAETLVGAGHVILQNLIALGGVGKVSYYMLPLVRISFPLPPCWST